MRIAIIGLGKVGSSLAFVLSQRGIASELMLVGREKASVMGDVLDLRHGQLFVETPCKITAAHLEEIEHADIIALCASVPMAANMSNRLQLAPGNVALLEGLIPKLAKGSPNSKIVVVSNPVDVLVYFTLELSGFRSNQVMGTGTLVDSARFRQLLADEIQIHAEDIRAYILGEHGESQFPAMSCADAGGEPIDDTPHRWDLFRQASQAGFDVFKFKGYTNYAIALAAADIIQCIARDTKHTMPISLKTDGFLGEHDVCLSLPAVVGANGVERVLHPTLNSREQQAFHRSAEIIRKTISEVRDNNLRHAE